MKSRNQRALTRWPWIRMTSAEEAMIRSWFLRWSLIGSVRISRRMNLADAGSRAASCLVCQARTSPPGRARQQHDAVDRLVGGQLRRVEGPLAMPDGQQGQPGGPRGQPAQRGARV